MRKKTRSENDQAAYQILEHTLSEMHGTYRDSTKIPLQARRDLVERVGKAYFLLKAGLPEQASIAAYLDNVEVAIASAYRSYIGTKEQNEFDSRQVELPGYELPVALMTRIADNTATNETRADGRIFPDNGVSIRCRVSGADKDLYRIFCFRPGWTRKVKKGKPKTKQRGPVMKWARNKLGANQLIDIRSSRFGIAVHDLYDFATEVTTLDDELAPVALDHLLSLPEIVNPHLKSREKDRRRGKQVPYEKGQFRVRYDPNGGKGGGRP